MKSLSVIKQDYHQLISKQGFEATSKKLIEAIHPDSPLMETLLVIIANQKNSNLKVSVRATGSKLSPSLNPFFRPNRQATILRFD